MTSLVERLLGRGRQPPPASEALGRRGRLVGGGEDILAEAIAAKLLHGWLQNRHQTLFPLTVNLRTLDAPRRQIVAEMMAVALLADAGGASAERLQAASAWLSSAGADEATLAALARAHAAPPALSAVVDAALGHGLAAYGYVAALVALPARDVACAHLLDYLAARLNLPTTVIRSANRRYRL